MRDTLRNLTQNGATTSIGVVVALGGLGMATAGDGDWKTIGFGVLLCAVGLGFMLARDAKKQGNDR